MYLPPSSSSPPHSRLSTYSNSICYTLSPSNSVFLVVLLLAPGSRSSFSSLCVLWPPTAPPILFFPHVPCISIFGSLLIPHTKHRSAHIHHHPRTSTITPSVYIFSPFRASPVISNSSTWEDDVLHRLISVSTFVGFPGWTFHRLPPGSVSLSLLPSSPQCRFIYSSALRCDPVRPYLFQLSV